MYPVLGVWELKTAEQSYWVRASSVDAAKARLSERYPDVKPVDIAEAKPGSGDFLKLSTWDIVVTPSPGIYDKAVIPDLLMGLASVAATVALFVLTVGWQ